MPLRNLYDALSPMPHLSTIIKLEPQEEPWCAGYAPSQGRRCKARTNAQGRVCAMSLLDEGTEDLQRGHCIDDVLEELAPHVLCRRFHQNQASELVRRWKRRVDSFIESQNSSTTSRTARHAESGSRHHVGSEQTVEQRLAWLEQELKDVAESLRIQRSAGSAAAVPVSSVDGLAREVGRLTSSIANGAATDDSVRISRDTAASVQGSSRNQSDSTRQIERDARVSSDYSPIRVSSVLFSSPRVSSSIPATNVTRRPVEGDCGICLCNLQEPQSYTTDEEDAEESESDGEESEETEDDENEESDEESEEDEDEEESDDEDQDSDEESEANEDGDHRGYYSNDDHSASILPVNHRLVWCKAKCGVNYHEECIDRWLESGDYTSCPTCRSEWRH